jgi:hypothetical protein
MNFKDLMTQLQSIDEGQQVVQEMNAMVIPSGAPQEQPDNVSMNINMTGQGPGGIRDLMAVLKNIEQGTPEPQHDHEPIMGEPNAHQGAEEPIMGDSYGNSAKGGSDAQVMGVDAVTVKGDDLASKSQGAIKHNGGENPMHENLVKKLTNMYNEIKVRNLNENVTLDESGQTFQHIVHTYKRDVKDFMENGELTNDLYEALYDYYFDDIPYGTKKARTGDPFEWISERFYSDLGGMDEGVVDVANTVGQGVGSVVGTAKDAWNAAKQGYNQTSTGSSTPANNVPAPMTPKGSLGLPPAVRPGLPPAVRPSGPDTRGTGPAPSTPPSTPNPGQGDPADALTRASQAADVNPMEESTDLTAMLKIAGLR